MDILFYIILIAVIIFAISYAIIKWYRDMALLKTVTDRYRGTQSERKLILDLLKNDIPAITIFHDLYIERRHGQYSQIDTVVVTRVGIIVFEVKDYSGWIFGKGYQNNWTQVLAYGKERHRFYNPIHQNRGHIESLKERLNGIADVPYYSVIIFYGKCFLKNISDIPHGVYVGYAENIMSIVTKILNNNPPAKYNDKWAVINTLREAVARGSNPEIRYKHIQNIRNFVG